MSAAGQRIVIVGATSAIAEHCARLWATGAAVDLCLVGRDAARLEAVAADLRVRSPGSRVLTRVLDAAGFLDPAAVERLVAAIAAEGPVDIALIAHGSLPDQEACQTDLALVRAALAVNGVSPVLFAEAFAGRFEAAGRGTLALIGSVAGERGRKSNYVYGAAKGLVARYAQGLQHRLAGSGAKVVLILPGPTATPMTAHLGQGGARLADPGRVAKRILRGIASGRPVVYAPAHWALIMMVIRQLPAWVFNRMDI